jgi:hypothetical protein
MIALLMKDVKASAPVLALFTVLFVLVGLPTVRDDEAFFWLAVNLAIGLWAIPSVLDWRSETDRFFCSLPVDRAAFVRAGAVWILVTTGIAAGLWMASGRLWIGLGAGSSRPVPAVPMWTTGDGLLAFAVVAFALAVVFLPCLFRFGIGKGSAVAGAVALASLGTASAMLQLAHAAGGTGPRLPAAALQQAVGTLRGHVGAPGVLVIAAAALTIVATISIALARRAFEQREF